jgi:hypothetical protein
MRLPNFPLLLLFANLACQFGLGYWVAIWHRTLDMDGSAAYWQQPVVLFVLFFLLFMFGELVWPWLRPQDPQDLEAHTTLARDPQPHVLNRLSAKVHITHYLTLFEIARGASLLLLVLNTDYMFKQRFPVANNAELDCVAAISGTLDPYFHVDSLNCHFYLESLSVVSNSNGTNPIQVTLPAVCLGSEQSFQNVYERCGLLTR